MMHSEPFYSQYTCSTNMPAEATGAICTEDAWKWVEQAPAAGKKRDREERDAPPPPSFCSKCGETSADGAIMDHPQCVPDTCYRCSVLLPQMMQMNAAGATG